MKTKPRLLLIDGENILHQSFHKFENLRSTSGVPSGAIYGFFKSLHYYFYRFDPDKVVITFDNGHSSFRMELNPKYKEHRKDISFDRESLQKQKHVILKLLGILRVTYIYDKHKSTNYEGDDFLAKLVLDNYKDHIVTIVSSDKDFNQLLIDKHIKIYNPRKEQYIFPENCKEVFGYTPKETVPYLCMVGDTSDDIPGIKGIGPVKARQILDNNPDFWKYVDTLSDDKKEVLYRNKKLIDLTYFTKKFKVKLPIKKYKNDNIDYDKFRRICIEYSFSSFLTPEFIETFKKLRGYVKK